ncbi:unnamed protein product, partial [Ilex paraguariensis]
TSKGGSRLNTVDSIKSTHRICFQDLTWSLPQDDLCHRSEQKALRLNASKPKCPPSGNPTEKK